MTPGGMGATCEVIWSVLSQGRGVPEWCRQVFGPVSFQMTQVMRPCDLPREAVLQPDHSVRISVHVSNIQSLTQGGYKELSLLTVALHLGLVS